MMNAKYILNLVEERKDELFELLSSLVKINSESFKSHGNEENLARHIDSLCKSLGLESEVYSPLDIPDFENHPDYMSGRGLENRYNVSAIWKGSEDKNGLMLMAHTDLMQINSLRYEKLKGNKYGLSSVRVSDKYRIEFEEQQINGEESITICNIIELSNHYK